MLSIFRNNKKKHAASGNPGITENPHTDTLKKKEEEIQQMGRALSELVSYYTFNGKNYKDCAEAVARIAREMGLGAEVVDGPNVIIDFNVGAKQTLLLATHYDVVDAGDPKKWKHNPFKLTEATESEETVWYGRGAADDKAGIVAALFALKELKETGGSNVNVRLLVTCDEEIGDKNRRGIRNLLDNFGVKGNAVIMVDGEPRIARASCGIVQGEIRITGGIEDTVKFLKDVAAFRSVREARHTTGLPSGEGRENPEFVWGRFSLTGLHMKGIINGANFSVNAGGDSPGSIPNECRVERKNRSGENVREPFVVDGVGGHAAYPHRAQNPIDRFIAGECKHAFSKDERKNFDSSTKVVFDMRLLPDEDPQSAIEKMLDWINASAKRHKLDSRVSVSITKDKKGYLAREDDPFVSLVKDALGEKSVYGDLAGSDMTFFGDRQETAILLGPMRWDDFFNTNIHSIDERVRV
ncbi:MAG: M20 family metallopeptidase, partial [Candidatus Micrarchaeota archaeon]